MIYMMIYTMIYIKVYWQRGFLPPLNEDDACMFTESERLIQEHVKKYKSGAAELKDLIQQVLHHPAFDPQDVDHDMHERLMRCMEDDDIQIIDLWEEGDGNQEVLQNVVPMFFDSASSTNHPSLYLCRLAMCWAVCH